MNTTAQQIFDQTHESPDFMVQAAREAVMATPLLFEKATEATMATPLLVEEILAKEPCFFRFRLSSQILPPNLTSATVNLPIESLTDFYSRIETIVCRAGLFETIHLAAFVTGRSAIGALSIDDDPPNYVTLCSPILVLFLGTLAFRRRLKTPELETNRTKLIEASRDFRSERQWIMVVLHFSAVALLDGEEHYPVLRFISVMFFLILFFLFSSHVHIYSVLSNVILFPDTRYISCYEPLSEFDFETAIPCRRGRLKVRTTRRIHVCRRGRLQVRTARRIHVPLVRWTLRRTLLSRVSADKWTLRGHLRSRVPSNFMSSVARRRWIDQV
jgi:hypothetical protein